MRKGIERKEKQDGGAIHNGLNVGLPVVTTRDTTMLFQKLYGGAFHSGHKVAMPEVTTRWHHHVTSEAGCQCLAK